MERSEVQQRSTLLANFYGSVVQDVIHNLRADFEVEGVDESVLDELQSLWETKLKNANVLPVDYRRPIFSPKLNLNVNPAYEGEGYTPTIDNVFPATPCTVNTPAQGLISAVSTPLVNSTSFFSPHERHGNYGYVGSRQLAEDNPGQPLDFMATPSMSREATLFDMNVVYEENGNDMYAPPPHEPPETKDYMDLSSTNKRKRDYYSTFLPQADGAGDIIDSSHSITKDERQFADIVVASMVESRNVRTNTITQLDGIDDNYDDHVAEEDYNLPGEEDPADAVDGDIIPVKEEGADSEGSEPPLNEDDDVDDFNEADQTSKTNNLVVAQFEKVTKVKGKWKCILKDGIMQLDKKDYLFSKANGEFDFF